MKKNKYLFAPLWAMLLLILSCKQDEVTAPHYMESWQAAKKTVTATRKTGGLELTLTYLPTEFLVLNDLGSNVPKSVYEQERANYCEHLYCTLRIKNESVAKDDKSAFNVPKYFVRERQRQFIGICGKDTLPCILYQPELMSNNTLETTVNLVFMRPSDQPCNTPISDDMTFLFAMNDSLKQVTRFDMTKNAINKLPKLKF